MQRSNLTKFLLLFFGIFALCYWGTKAVIGLAAPGGYYSPFVAQYLDYVSLLRHALMIGSAALLGLFGIETFREGDIILRGTAGGGIKLVYGCLAIGVMSFWIAYTAASARGWRSMFLWMFGGLLVIFILNIIRLSLVLVASQNGWVFPFGLDHHGWFNIAVYGILFLMIFLFERNTNRVTRLRQAQADNFVVKDV